MQKSKKRLTLFQRIARALVPHALKVAAYKNTRKYQRWEQGWKRNALFKGKPLTRSMICRVGSRYRAVELGLIKA